MPAGRFQLGVTAGSIGSVALGLGLALGACSSPSPAGGTPGDASLCCADAAQVGAPGEASDDALPDAAGDVSADAGDADSTIDASDGNAPSDTGLDALDAIVLDAPPDSPDDAPPDATGDASLDAADSAPGICGDGVRDPATEECDNGAGNVDITGACSTTCQVQDFLATSTISSTDAGPLLPFQYPPHTLGQGRHPIVGGPGGFAVAFLEQEATGDFILRAEAFDPGGVRIASFPIVGTPGPAISGADPVLAATSRTQYVAVWGDTGAGPVGPGIALAVLDTSSGTVGTVAHANAPTESPETAPDALWTGSSLVVAWVDGAGASSDIKVRTFDGSLVPTSAESYLANTADEELDVTLAPFNGTWAAAWRASENGLETVHVKAGSVEVVTGPVWGGAAGERPALVQVGPTTLFVAFSVTVPTDDAGEQSTSVLQGAVVDLSAQGGATVTASELAFDALADGGSGRYPEGTPGAVAASGQLWLAAWTGAQPGDPLEDEVWLASAPNAAAAGIGGTVIPLPRWEAHRAGDQRNPALAVTTLGGSGALVAAWEDFGAGVAVAEARPDVVVEVAPLPIGR